MTTIEISLGTLPWAVQRHIDAADGWTTLRDLHAANEELEKIPAAHQNNIDVVKRRAHANLTCAPSLALQLTTQLLNVKPDAVEFLIYRSFALRVLGRVQDALDLLLPFAGRFPGYWIVPYNLACYFSQLDRLKEAVSMLNDALAIDDSMSMHLRALCDPDLKPVWAEGGFRLPHEPGMQACRRTISTSR
jgi:tetratricopeptide (TPR) repeat protein